MATKSLSVSACTLGEVTSTNPIVSTSDTGANSRMPVVGQPGLHGWRNHGGQVCEQERVAVGWRARDEGPSDGLADARAVIDDHRCVQCQAEVVRKRAGYDISRTAGHERNHDRDRLAWKPLCQRGARPIREGLTRSHLSASGLSTDRLGHPSHDRGDDGSVDGGANARLVHSSPAPAARSTREPAGSTPAAAAGSTQEGLAGSRSAPGANRRARARSTPGRARRRRSPRPEH